MKTILKSEPAFFKKFIEKENPENWEATYPIRQDLRSHLISEQNNQCAYTEMYIEMDIAEIDHFKRKASHLFPTLQFDYQNLFAIKSDCVTEEGKYGAYHKDNYVTEPNQYNNLLSPVTNNVEVAFSYIPLTGEIKGETDAGKYTIEVFNLNHPVLLKRRQQIGKHLIVTYIRQGFTLEQSLSFFKGFEAYIRYIYANYNN